MEALCSTFGGCILFILGTTQYFRGLDIVYTMHYAVFSVSILNATGAYEVKNNSSIRYWGDPRNFGTILRQLNQGLHRMILRQPANTVAEGCLQVMPCPMTAGRLWD